MLTTAQLLRDRKIRREELAHMPANARRVSMERRLKIDRGCWDDLAKNHIRSQFETPEMAGLVCGFVDTSVNVQSRVVDRMAVAYKHPPARMIGTQKAASAKWQSLMREAKINKLAKVWGRYAYLCNVIFVVPHVRPIVDGDTVERRLGYETILPDRVVDVFFGDDPTWPDVIVYEHGDNPDTGAYETDTGPERPTYVALDAFGWTYLSQRWSILEFRPHGVNRKIHVPFRTHDGQPGDFWDWRRNSDLITASCEVQRVWATMGYVRKGQNRKLQTLTGPNLEEVPDEQVQAAEQAMLLQGMGLEFKIHEFSQAIDHFKDEIRLRIEMVSEARGIPSSMVDLDTSAADASNVSPMAARANHVLLSEKRDDQIECLRDAEHELAYRTALVCEAANHPKAVDPETVRREFRVDWPPLTFAEEPLARLQVGNEKVKAGLSDQVSMYREYHPELSWHECATRILGPDHGLTERDGHVAVRNAINDELSRHQTPLDPRQSGEQLSARQGRIGGQAPPPAADESDE